MGGTSYSVDMHTASLMAARSSGVDYFTHTSSIASGTARAGVHEKLDPSKANAAGQLIRESRDSAAHPNSLAIGVLFDVTGSMRGVPRTFVEKLGKLMGLLVKKGYVEDPQILFGAIGDAYSDAAPLQVGQFESGNEMDEALSLIYLEGNGGGGRPRESYQLGAYYMARHTSMDCLEKRGKKGYLFILGDETPYEFVKKDQVAKLIGDGLEADVSTKDIFEELRNKFEVFWIVPGGTSHFNDRNVLDPLQDLMGQNLIKLENPDDVCELIASTIALNEGYDLDSVATDLKDIGADADSVNRASKALAVYAGNNKLAVRASVSGELAAAGSDDVARL